MLRWNLERGFVVIPKTVRPERMTENAAVFDFELTKEDHQAIAALDRARPSILDLSKVAEVERVWDYGENPVLTTL